MDRSDTTTSLLVEIEGKTQGKQKLNEDRKENCVRKRDMRVQIYSLGNQEENLQHTLLIDIEARRIKILSKIQLIKEIRLICSGLQVISYHWGNPYPIQDTSIPKIISVD